MTPSKHSIPNIIFIRVIGPTQKFSSNIKIKIGIRSMEIVFQKIKKWDI